MTKRSTRARTGQASIDSALLLVCVLVACTGLLAVGGGIGRSVSGVVVSSPAHVQGTSLSTGVEVGGRQQAGVLNALRKAVETLPAIVIRGDRWQSVGAAHIAQSLERAFADDDVLAIARHLAMTKLGNVEAPIHAAQSPSPAEYASAMRAFSKSSRYGESSAQLRQVYERALSHIVPLQLDLLDRQFDDAFIALRQELADTRRAAAAVAPELLPELNARWTKINSLAFFGGQRSALDGRLAQARLFLGELQAKSELSAAEVFELAQLVENVKYGEKTNDIPRNFMPVFSETYHYPSEYPANMVDALIEAKALHAVGLPIMMPADIEPFARVGAPRYGDRVTRGHTLSEYATDLFELAERSHVSPEATRRRAMVRETFPGSQFYAESPEEARALIAATFDQAVNGWQQNKVDAWLLKIRDAKHVKAQRTWTTQAAGVADLLKEAEKATLDRITSLWRIWTGTNSPR